MLQRFKLKKHIYISKMPMAALAFCKNLYVKNYSVITVDLIIFKYPTHIFY